MTDSYVTDSYIVGIDLGTTHTALAYAAVGAQAIETFAIPQLVSHGSIDTSVLLPSFMYAAHESDGLQPLPWGGAPSYAVGAYARSRGVDAPARVVASAKSWLGHSSIDRRAAILPQGAPTDVALISPVEASRRYLEHLVQAWNFAGPGDTKSDLRKQHVVLTVPASFDAGALELTREAATAAGFEHLTLLEEPQAALYAWLDRKRGSWRSELKAGDVVLVVDVGGGTTDFSVIAAVDHDGELTLERIAVGDHILLGGDNMDMLLAHRLEQRLIEAATHAGKTLELDRFQRVSLQHAARAAKEQLLGDGAREAADVAIAGRGSKLVGSTLRTTLTRDEVTRAIVDGFFPLVSSADRPTARTRGGLTQIGLPYAQDPAVTKHLALLLSRHAQARRGSPLMLHPTHILFNGGVMKSPTLRNRIVECVDAWGAEDGAPKVNVLEGNDPDLAVARGAAAYGVARRGGGIRIRGGTARAYYVGIEGAAPAVPGVEPPLTAVCVAPFGMEEGTSVEVGSGELGIVVGERVRFRFFGSSVRRTDGVGATLERWAPGELEELSPIEVELASDVRSQGEVVPVALRSAITEVGTLELDAVPASPRSAGEQWRVALSVRTE